MLDFVRDIYASFRQTSLERVKSPFLGAFVFSWFGFNWQILSILFLSEQKIEQRLEIINKSNDIGNYLLGPICTTALIVMLLPQINKLITKIQDKPNSETVEMSLASKIKIAELQQSIAEIEARKKLAEKKEERNIEEGIENIKTKLKETTSDLDEKNVKINSLLTEFNKLEGKLAKAESKLVAEQETKSQMQSEITTEKENNRVLGSQLLDLKALANKFEADLKAALELHQKTNIANKQLKDKIENLNLMMLTYAHNFPEIFEIEDSNEQSFLGINPAAKGLLSDLSEKLKSNKIQIKNGKFNFPSA